MVGPPDTWNRQGITVTVWLGVRGKPQQNSVLGWRCSSVIEVFPGRLRARLLIPQYCTILGFSTDLVGNLDSHGRPRGALYLDGENDFFVPHREISPLWVTPHFECFCLTVR